MPNDVGDILIALTGEICLIVNNVIGLRDNLSNSIMFLYIGFKLFFLRGVAEECFFSRTLAPKTLLPSFFSGKFSICCCYFSGAILFYPLI